MDSGSLKKPMISGARGLDVQFKLLAGRDGGAEADQVCHLLSEPTS